MSNLGKEDKRNMKQFRLNDKEDCISYLQEIIVRTFKCIQKHKKYLNKLSNYIEEQLDKNQGKDIKEIKVKFDEYSEFMDLLSSVESYSLNLIGDNQKSSISYMKFRDLIKRTKQEDILNSEVKKLSDEDVQLLNNINKLRNWQNHVPESLLTSTRKLINEGKVVKPKNNPITINIYNYCTLEYVKDLYNRSIAYHDVIVKMHQNMKKDYSCLIGKSMRVEKLYIDRPFGLEHCMPAKMSLEIQGF